ncbi:Heavy metal transport/detoxification superfamily protein [Rhynchospora pubera]|uniref:Heavy metal transport/detoxification superfamily protein n=1 Tax=Rhynchospora pubera TaxID=906938 RepID=A0AAV8F629_9POAL|nr:Heavy metal transport/detoxification superfamily protein [Rhynchospora pubera]
MKKIVVKVSIFCEKCKTLTLKTVAKLEGIQSLNLDSEKGTLTVVGSVDPVCIVSALKKKKRPAQIESVGPPEEKKEDKKEDEKKKECEEACKKFMECCRSCSKMPYPSVIFIEEPYYGCTIM